MTDAITYRTDDLTRWGTGQGARLTARQADINFWTLFSMITALADHASTEMIASITASGNQLFVTMADGTVFGPFTLPGAQWTFRDEGWLPSTLYSPFDVFENNGSLYLVKFRHVSAATFDPAANDGDGHDFYQRILAPGPYDAGMFFPDHIPSDGSLLFMHVAARAFYLPAGLFPSVATLDKHAAGELVLPVYKNKTLIGAVLFGGSHADVQSDGSEVGSFLFLQAVQFQRGDRLLMYAPDDPTAGPDATAQGLGVTFAGIVGIVSP
jgi:hypothetical protein